MKGMLVARSGSGKSGFIEGSDGKTYSFKMPEHLKDPDEHKIMFPTIDVVFDVGPKGNAMNVKIDR